MGQFKLHSEYQPTGDHATGDRRACAGISRRQSV